MTEHEAFWFTLGLLVMLTLVLALIVAGVVVLLRLAIRAGFQFGSQRVDLKVTQ